MHSGMMAPDGTAMPGWMPGRGPGWRNQSMPGRGRFAMIHANENGTVSAEEAASAADSVFTAMDSDDDGGLTKDEYMSVRMGPQLGRNPERRSRRQAAKEARFSEMDGDGDGTVSKEEFMAAAKSHHASADTDGDGQVSPWEHRRRNWN
jgi:Ca2+-binding EF-hand superfamily protein